MLVKLEQRTPQPPVTDAGSDYGSDFDTDGEQALNDILTEADGASQSDIFNVLESIEEHEPAPSTVRVPKVQSTRRYDLDAPVVLPNWDRPLREPSVEVEYDEVFRTSWTSAKEISFTGRERDREVSVSAEPENGAPDTRSPLELFRTAPKKPLSVTDIVSPAWCELQYWYTLKKHGRKIRTPLMKQGTMIHKVLEEQVHKFVPVDVTTKEDAWGLKIWNVIQGLRTLRTTGMTRELEIWGIEDGQVINGIIDLISYTCPNEELEGKILSSRANGSGKKELPPDQRSMAEFLTPTGAVRSDSQNETAYAFMRPTRRVYLTDVKSRVSNCLPEGPPEGPALRPTAMQLMLYRRILADIAANKVDAQAVFDRYGLKASDPFSDAFIAQVGSVSSSFSEDSSDEDHTPLGSSQDPVSELLEHNSLTSLWSLMIREYGKAIKSNDGIGDVLSAEFRWQRSGEILGSRTFAHVPDVIEKWLRDELSWWKGEREAKGVDIEEAFKCRKCDFAESCTWRKGKIEEATKKSRLRNQARTKSEI
ncbi:hypothetical protein B0A49_06323 [Cryomyces minteri]|uniref:Exonuclease V, mitochondrial n=1 Tax=Cryomyces minteri TaxID=331657 RepID=A0A4U0WMY2_9PEZI|nr:hypothetical protein B0A49_06323 [Cryomyces minteri]